MQSLKERIVRDGVVKAGNVLKVDSFLNHQMDVALFDEMGAEFHRRFAGERVTKILTVEASGIGIACLAGHLDDGYEPASCRRRLLSDDGGVGEHRRECRSVDGRHQLPFGDAGVIVRHGYGGDGQP